MRLMHINEKEKPKHAQSVKKKSINYSKYTIYVSVESNQR